MAIATATQAHLRRSNEQPTSATCALVLADESIFWGTGLGIEGITAGEFCFNTSMTGYQEIITDPSYADQIITFTFPHIGNIGTNDNDLEHNQTFAERSSWKKALKHVASERPQCVTHEQRHIHEIT